MIYFQSDAPYKSRKNDRKTDRCFPSYTQSAMESWRCEHFFPAYWVAASRRNFNWVRRCTLLRIAHGRRIDRKIQLRAAVVECGDRAMRGGLQFATHWFTSSSGIPARRMDSFKACESTTRVDWRRSWINQRIPLGRPEKTNKSFTSRRFQQAVLQLPACAYYVCRRAQSDLSACSSSQQSGIRLSHIHAPSVFRGSLLGK